jgi:DNA-binding NarL/FixJ family response regulator
MRAKILIVDDHEVVRQGARAILQKARPEWVICGEALTGTDAVQAVLRDKPDVVIMDITMPGMSGLEAAAEITRLAPESRVLLFTMHESDTLIVQGRQIGAQGYVLKSQAGRDLVVAIEALLGGGTFFQSLPETENGAPSAKKSDRGNTETLTNAAECDAAELLVASAVRTCLAREVLGAPGNFATLKEQFSESPQCSASFHSDFAKDLSNLQLSILAVIVHRLLGNALSVTLPFSPGRVYAHSSATSCR